QRLSNLSYGREDSHSRLSLFLFDGDPGEGFALNHQRFIGELTHLTVKSIAASGNCRDVTGVAGAFTKRSPDRRHVNGEVRFFDNLIRPNQLKELVLGKQTTTIANQNQQHLERFAVQRHDLAPPPELPLFRIELKLVEFVDESGV